MQPFFRVDKRRFSVGDRITTAGEYYDKLAVSARAIEDGLDCIRPKHLPRRQECLFVFEDIEVARRHWSKMAGGILYRVEVVPHDHLHRGDMALMDSMKALAESGSEWQCTAHRYWKGDHTLAPEIEVLVSSAVVVEVLYDSNEQRLAYLRKRWGFGSE